MTPSSSRMTPPPVHCVSPEGDFRVRSEFRFGHSPPKEETDSSQPRRLTSRKLSFSKRDSPPKGDASSEEESTPLERKHSAHLVRKLSLTDGKGNSSDIQQRRQPKPLTIKALLEFSGPHTEYLCQLIQKIDDAARTPLGPQLSELRHHVQELVCQTAIAPSRSEYPWTPALQIMQIFAQSLSRAFQPYNRYGVPFDAPILRIATNYFPPFIAPYTHTHPIIPAIGKKQSIAFPEMWTKRIMGWPNLAHQIAHAFMENQGCEGMPQRLRDQFEKKLEEKSLTNLSEREQQIIRYLNAYFSSRIGEMGADALALLLMGFSPAIACARCAVMSPSMQESDTPWQCTPINLKSRHPLDRFKICWSLEMLKFFEKRIFRFHSATYLPPIPNWEQILASHESAVKEKILSNWLDSSEMFGTEQLTPSKIFSHFSKVILPKLLEVLSEIIPFDPWRWNRGDEERILLLSNQINPYLSERIKTTSSGPLTLTQKIEAALKEELPRELRLPSIQYDARHIVPAIFYTLLTRIDDGSAAQTNEAKQRVSEELFIIMLKMIQERS